MAGTVETIPQTKASQSPPVAAGRGEGGIWGVQTLEGSGPWEAGSMRESRMRDKPVAAANPSALRLFDMAGRRAITSGRGRMTG